MARFDEARIDAIAILVQQRHQALQSALGLPPAPTDRLDRHSPLYQHLQLLAQIANGEHIRGRATVARIAQVEASLAYIIELLLGNAFHATTTIPDGFWQTDVGILVSRARWWLSADELITISNAAALAFGANTQANRMRIVRAIDNGQLEWVRDPSVANPQQQRRVLRPQVERWREQRRSEEQAERE